MPRPPDVDRRDRPADRDPPTPGRDGGRFTVYLNGQDPDAVDPGPQQPPASGRDRPTSGQDADSDGAASDVDAEPSEGPALLDWQYAVALFTAGSGEARRFSSLYSYGL